MSNGWDKEMYEELYAIRSRVDSVDAHVKEIVSELMKIRAALEADRISRSGHGGDDPTTGASKRPTSPYKIPDGKKRFGFL